MIALVCIDLMMHRSSATSERCGKSSHIQMPLFPWRWNLYMDGATSCVLPRVMAVTRCPKLVGLPEGLRISQMLCIQGCPSLTKLPRRLEVLGGHAVGDQLRSLLLLECPVQNEVEEFIDLTIGIVSGKEGEGIEDDEIVFTLLFL